MRHCPERTFKYFDNKTIVSKFETQFEIASNFFAMNMPHLASAFFSASIQFFAFSFVFLTSSRDKWIAWLVQATCVTLRKTGDNFCPAFKQYAAPSVENSVKHSWNESKILNETSVIICYCIPTVSHCIPVYPHCIPLYPTVSPLYPHCIPL